MPRVWRYVEHDLDHPALAQLKAWYDEHVPAKWRGDFLARQVEDGA
jgi:aminoglycoside/choline kinase family phosphotransferase